MAVLIWQSGTRKGERIALDAAPFVIGRGAQNALVIASDQVSRRHAELTRAGDGWLLSDLGSTNGTTIGGRRLTAPERLAAGDEFAVGPFRFRLELDERTPGEPPGGAERAGSVSDGPQEPGARGQGPGKVSGFGLRASDQAGGTPTPGSSPGQALKPEARSLKPEIAPRSATRPPPAAAPRPRRRAGWLTEDLGQRGGGRRLLVLAAAVLVFGGLLVGSYLGLRALLGEAPAREGAEGPAIETAPCVECGRPLRFRRDLMEARPPDRRRIACDECGTPQRVEPSSWGGWRAAREQ